MTIPKFILASDFISSPDQFYVVHTQHPQFIAINSKTGMKPRIVVDFVKSASAKEKEAALADAQVYLFDQDFLGPEHAPDEEVPPPILARSFDEDDPAFIIVTKAPYGIFGIGAVESPFPQLKKKKHFIVELQYEDYFGARSQSQKDACLNQALNFYSLCESSYGAAAEITDFLNRLDHNQA